MTPLPPEDPAVRPSRPAWDVRLMERADLEAVAEVAREARLHPWTRETFAAELDRTCAHLLVVQGDDGAILGYLLYWLVHDEIEILDVATRTDARRRGVARALLHACVARARRDAVRAIFLEVRASNAGATALYRAMGFEEVGVRRGYYEDNGEDALQLALPIERDGL